MRQPTDKEIEKFCRAGIKFSECTCIKCHWSDLCDYAYDLYNQDGVCLLRCEHPER